MSKRPVDEGTDSTSKRAKMGETHRGFDSTIVTLHVGFDCKRFTAHESILSASPVLRQMCQSIICSSSGSKLLFLGDDRPNDIELLIEYLYTERLAEKTVTHLSSLYMVAEKYQLPVLQNAIFTALKATPNIHDYAKIVFRNAELVYPRIEPTDTLYRKYFKAEATACFHRATATSWANYKVEDTIKRGGILAWDIFAAQTHALKTATQETKEAAAKWTRKQEDALALRKDLDDVVDKKAKLEVDHSINHKECKECERFPPSAQRARLEG